MSFKTDILAILNDDKYIVEIMLNAGEKPGQVIFSDDSPNYRAWYAFNSDKNNYPYAEIFSDGNGDYFLGYETDDNLNSSLGSFFIEFEPNSKPSSFGIEISNNGIIYEEIYRKNSDIQNIETANFIENYIGYKYFRYRFYYNNIDPIRVKQAQFFYQDVTLSNFERFLDKVPGVGTVNVDFENKIITGNIENPFGFVPAIYYATGILTGNITENIGSFTWNNIFIEDPGQVDKVYLNYATGYIQSTGLIEIDAFYQNNLNNFDTISINNVSFTYVTGTPQNLFQFNTIENLVQTLNSGSQGLYNNNTLQNTVGISGNIEYTYPYHKIYLTSISRSGEDGNNNKIYRDCVNLNTIIIKNRYFQGGETLRPKINNWFGTFSNTFDQITAENTGFYSRSIVENSAGVIQDVTWEDNFSGNYYITTGIRDPNSEQIFSGALMKFDSNLNKYYASITIPGGSSLYVYTGFKFNILKPDPYNIQGNLAKYIINGQNINGENFTYSGIIIG